MGRRTKKSDAALISLLIIVGLPIAAAMALYEAMGPVLFFGSLFAIVAGYIWYLIYRAKEQERLARIAASHEAARQPQRLEALHNLSTTNALPSEQFAERSPERREPAHAKTMAKTTAALWSEANAVKEIVMNQTSSTPVPWFGARKFARSVLAALDSSRGEIADLRHKLEECGGLTLMELEAKRKGLEAEISRQSEQIAMDQAKAIAAQADELAKLSSLRKQVVETQELAMLQESGVYEYKHPLSDVVAYQAELARIQAEIKDKNRKDGGAILASTNWSVNGSASQGAAMVRDFSKLMLRAFNAEADNLVRDLKPYKLDRAIERLTKVASTIEKLGSRMGIRIADPYLQLRNRELELTADFRQKQAEEKEAERVERERLREERKVQLEIERERERLEKEKQHYTNAIEVLTAKGDHEAVLRLQTELAEVHKAILDVDYRAANIRAGYVYVISNVGSFGQDLVKVGLTRRLDPMDRIHELSDASVPFNFDVHAMFFSKDAVTIENDMHKRLAERRVNTVNLRREFFRATPMEVKKHLAEVAGDLLEFRDEPEALEYRQSRTKWDSLAVPSQDRSTNL
jgi:Domain of unknown function (DUF4041)/Meiotically up-regulated gene 113